ncbi:MULTISPECIES: ABC transporter ATP-binding protein [Aneurinibacillus]|uniref:ABC transporter ATP-binding protein n=1 Tax=Aneurinibacillus thermoaerophilus TaxID=143495 RepID=A0A1G8E0A8_ANETH|nr:MULTISPECIES: ABC transporter ATP-binding protein [Aneurinibacillus]AMA74149.1 hypothetical protein ACH33_15870 [Aneurinibacillus sp. XH2]MED0677270.1 ABC transporter ATP-binding protein [Aneurinibacillus thermoaerophilus]MED0677891.1 ABC transporter ATP-binding protein [Aneurinibacillus thermoaerophilus]MED0738553.1 ABC transporter ATP-binding protein [Aneurinibacillus thermoaerophilus]MED0758400.1 ABC transporter ATP-binding protein [Aneurinibacillus thermoaerophilus]
MKTAFVLTVKNLSKTYGEYKAVHPLTFCIRPGEIHGLLGPNGAGKTTTIKMIIGVLEKTSGDIEINGISLQEEPVRAKRNVFYVPDHPVLFEKMTGKDFLSFMADLYGVDYCSSLVEIESVINRFQLTPHLAKSIGEMSLGTRQKLLLTAGLMVRAPLLILDEPIVGLDPESILYFKECLREYAQQGGAVLFSTHLLFMAQELCTHLVVMKQGTMIAAGPASELISKQNQNLEQVFMEMIAHGE